MIVHGWILENENLLNLLKNNWENSKSKNNEKETLNYNEKTTTLGSILHKQIVYKMKWATGKPMHKWIKNDVQY